MAVKLAAGVSKKWVDRLSHNGVMQRMKTPDGRKSLDAARLRTEAVLDAHPYIPMETSHRDLGIIEKREALLDNLNSDYVLRGVP